jgi:ubiquinone/menaquinone biosynthesis C-methylase UbiE
MRVLDAGCCAGNVSFLTARPAGPAGAVIEADRSAGAVALVAKRAVAA